MIVDTKSKDGVIQGRGRTPMHVEEFDLLNRAANNVEPFLNLMSVCCKQKALIVRYRRETKTVLFNCPQCGNFVSEVKVAEKGNAIIC